MRCLGHQRKDRHNSQLLQVIMEHSHHYWNICSSQPLLSDPPSLRAQDPNSLGLPPTRCLLCLSNLYDAIREVTQKKRLSLSRILPLPPFPGRPSILCILLDPGSVLHLSSASASVSLLLLPAHTYPEKVRTPISSAWTILFFFFHLSLTSWALGGV